MPYRTCSLSTAEDAAGAAAPYPPAPAETARQPGDYPDSSPGNHEFSRLSEPWLLTKLSWTTTPCWGQWIRTLASHRPPPHDYPITAREAKTLGLPVHTDMPGEIYQFMEFFPQQTRTLPSVEYVPHPERHGHGKRA